MERELRQEALRHKVKLSLNAEIANTSIIGFFKWLSRGGKPEFIGVTRLKVPLNFIVPDNKEVSDVKENRSERHMQNYFYIPTLDKLAIAIEEIKYYEKRGTKISLPLNVILSNLEELMLSNSELLRNALYGENI